VKAIAIPQAGEFLPIDLCAELGPILLAGLEGTSKDGRLNGRRISGDAFEAVERMEIMGAQWRRHSQRVASEVASVDEEGCKPGEWESVKDAAHTLGISRQAVEKSIASDTPGSLHGEKVNQRWRVSSESVRARRKELENANTD